MTTIHKTPSETEIASTLSDLKLSPTAPQKPLHKPKSKPVADSWDDESSDTETESASQSTAAAAAAVLPRLGTNAEELSLPPQPPPPTPASPTPFDFPNNSHIHSQSNSTTASAATHRSRGDSGVSAGNLDKRPEKTTAVAGRLIAGALGVRPPRRTDEEREFDRVMREKERKRRAEEREREKKEAEAREERKRSVWED